MSLIMFLLPMASSETRKKWQGTCLQGHKLSGYVVMWCGEPYDGTLTKSLMKPMYVFILKHSGIFKYATLDNRGFVEIPEKWHAKCFQNIGEIPSTNSITMNIDGSYVDLPFLPPSLFSRKSGVKRRKKTHAIQHRITYPMWKHQSGSSVPLKVAKSFKDLFDRADAGEVLLQDPFAGYQSVEDIQANKTGRMAYKTVASFIYHHCRDNLGYPLVI